MTRHNHLRLAGSAIAAALALGTTPAIGQDAAAPPITIVIPQPTAAPAPVRAAPVAEIETSPAAAMPEAATTTASTRRSAAATPASRARAAAVRSPVTPAPVPARDDAPAVTSADAVVPEVVPPVAVEAAPITGPVVASNEGANDELLFGAGLAAALGLGALGLAFARRRRGTREVAAYETTPVEPTLVAAAPEPAPVAPPMATPQRTSPAVFAMPAAVPEDGLAHRELIDRMVAATPDAANPFKTRKTRTRRARQILADRIADQRPALEDRVVVHDAAPVSTNPQREFEQA